MDIDIESILTDLSAASGNFQTEKSLNAGNPTYVHRKEDGVFLVDELVNDIINDKFCWVTGPPRSGKSSLKNWAISQLRENDYRCIDVKLSGYVDRFSTSEEWYYYFVYQICNVLKKTSDLKIWWDDNLNSFPDPGERAFQFLQKILLPSAGDDIVIFVDDIHLLAKKTKANINAYDFLRLINGLYESAKLGEDEEVARIDFVIIGTAFPGDLLYEGSKKGEDQGADETGEVNKNYLPLYSEVEPFFLDNLRVDEARLPLAGGFDFLEVDKGKLIEEVFRWTDGQPYLTQKICQSINETQRGVTGIEQVVEENVNELFLNDHIDADPHLKELADNLVEIGENSAVILDMYQSLRSEGKIADSDLGTYEKVRRKLLLSGLVTEAGNQPQINRIYREIFNEDWIYEAQKKVDRPYFARAKEWKKLTTDKDKQFYALKDDELKKAKDWMRLRDDITPSEKEYIDYSDGYEKRLLRKKIITRSILTIIIGFFAVAAITAAVLAFISREEAKSAEKMARNLAASEKKAREDADILAANETKLKLEAEDAKNLAQEARDQEIIAKLAMKKARDQEKIAKDSALVARDKEKKQRLIADSLTQTEKIARLQATELSRLAKAQALAFKATQYYQKTNMNGLLALTAYFLNKDNGGEERDPEIYKGMQAALTKLKGPRHNVVFEYPRDVISFDIFNTGVKKDAISIITVDGEIWSDQFKTSRITRLGNSQILSYKRFPIDRAFLYPASNLYVIGYENNAALLWKRKTREDLAKQDNVALEFSWVKLNAEGDDLKGRLRASDISPPKDGTQYLAAGGRDQVIRIWDINDLEKGLIVPPPKLGASVRTLAFTSDGSKLVSGDENGKIIIWDVSKLKGGTIKGIDTIAKIGTRNISSDIKTQKNILVVGYSDGHIKKIDLTSKPFVIDSPKFINEVGIECIAINKEATLFSIASADATIKVYDLERLNEKPLIISDHRQKVDALRFNNVNQIYALCRDNTIRYWDTDLERMKHELCSQVDAMFTSDEWKDEVEDSDTLLTIDKVWSNGRDCVPSFNKAGVNAQ